LLFALAGKKNLRFSPGERRRKGSTEERWNISFMKDDHTALGRRRFRYLWGNCKGEANTEGSKSQTEEKKKKKKKYVTLD